MCLTVKGGSLQEVTKYAKKDMYVWKVFSVDECGRYRSPFQDTMWRKGRYQTVGWFTAQKYIYRDQIEVAKGLHAFKRKKDAETAWFVGVSDDVHDVVLKMKIPKGTAYIENGIEIVALKMRIV